MLRFIPTASGDLHFGHLACILAIKEVARLEYEKEICYIIDNAQVANWKLYPEKEELYSHREINSSIESIRKTMSYLFQGTIYFRGCFLDDEFIDRAEEITHFNEKIIYLDGYKYSVPFDNYELTYNGNIIFDALKSYYKNSSFSMKIWNPFLMHEIVDKTIGTTFQVVDTNLYCPWAFAYDCHVNSKYYYDYWKKHIGRQNYNIITIPRIISEDGEISKSKGAKDFSVYPLDTCFERFLSAFEINSVQDIGEKLLNSDASKPYVIRRPQ